MYMDIKSLQKLIRECITEVKENSKDFDELQFMRKYNPQMWRQWLRTGEADMGDMTQAVKDAHSALKNYPRPGSDTEDSEIGKTNFPKGYGYPNKSLHLGDNWKDNISIDYFSDVDYEVGQEYEQWVDKILIKKLGVPYHQSYNVSNETPTYWNARYGINNLDRDNKGRKAAMLVTAKINQILRQHGINDYDVNTGLSQQYEKELQDFYNSNKNSNENSEKYIKALTGVSYKGDFDSKDTIFSYMDSQRWSNTREQTNQILRQHGINDYDVNIGVSLKYEKYVKLIEKYKQHPINNVTYPSFVSAYDVTRNFGGHEEGGWYYDKKTHIASLKVKNRIQAIKSAIILFKEFSRNTDGLIKIVAEKEARGVEKKEKTPNWS